MWNNVCLLTVDLANGKTIRSLRMLFNKDSSIGMDFKIDGYEKQFCGNGGRNCPNTIQII